MSLFLVIDLGTTGLKIALINESGTIIAQRHKEYPILYPKAGYAEQDPKLWWSSFIELCQGLNHSFPDKLAQVQAIGICGQMHTNVLLDKKFQILRPAITWMDQRSSEIVREINEDKKKSEFIFKNTQNVITTTYTAPQLKWVEDNEPDIWSKVEHVLVAKDFLKWKLTGNMITDFSDACGTLLFDVANVSWSEDMFDFFGFSSSLFPEARPSDEIMGTINKETAQLTGIKEGTPVTNGSSDNSAAALGAGMVKSGQVTLIIGTAGVITVCSNRPLIDSQHRTLCWNYCLRDKWATLGILQTAGESLNWFKNAFDREESAQSEGKDIFSEYDQWISKIPDGSEGLIFLPYLNGERTPYWDPFARGVFFGINLFSSKAHFIKAVMEGVSFALRNNVETVESLGIKIEEMRAVGGGSKSLQWLEILGKILSKLVYTVKISDTGLVGNMLLSGKAIGLYSSIEKQAEKVVKLENKIYYPEKTDVYEKQYAIFLSLYNKLKDSFKALAV